MAVMLWSLIGPAGRLTVAALAPGMSLPTTHSWWPTPVNDHPKFEMSTDTADRRRSRARA